jgi:RNA polymerase sigma-70 factor (ECF subfamily)
MLTIEIESLSDEEIVALTLNYQLDYFEHLVDRYSKPLYNYLLRLLYFHVQDAEDGLSETFLKAYKNLNGFDPKLKFSSWVYRIAHNQAMDMLRKKKYKIVPIEDHIQRFSFTPDMSGSQKEDLEKMLQLLKEKDRNILTLYYLEEKTINEIAIILKERPQTISVWIHRAKTRAQLKIKNTF